MPQIIKLHGYSIYFWSNEGEPIEPIHVHVSKGSPNGNSTKIWVTSEGKTLICNNNSKIPKYKLKILCDLIEARSFEIISKWQEYFDELTFYC